MSVKLDHEAYIRDVTDAMLLRIREVTASALRNCVTCEMFEQRTEICNHYKAKPPAAVIIRGCDEYVNEIPF